MVGGKDNAVKEYIEKYKVEEPLKYYFYYTEEYKSLVCKLFGYVFKIKEDLISFAIDNSLIKQEDLYIDLKDDDEDMQGLNEIDFRAAKLTIIEQKPIRNMDLVKTIICDHEGGYYFYDILWKEYDIIKDILDVTDPIYNEIKGVLYKVTDKDIEFIRKYYNKLQHFLNLIEKVAKKYKEVATIYKDDKNTELMDKKYIKLLELWNKSHYKDLTHKPTYEELKNIEHVLLKYDN